MASSGTFTGSRGTSGGPWLTLDWDIIDVDIPNNRSLVRLTLKLNADSSLNFSSSKTGSLEGTSFTFTSGFSGTGSKVLKTKDMWCNHNSDGTKSWVFNGDFDIAITYSGSWISTLTVSGTAVLNPIPRASDFTAFTLSNTVLNVDTATTINYTLDRKDSSYSQAMTLKYGSKTIASWTTSSTGSLTRTLTAAEVNTIINAMSSVTSGNLTLIMQTMSGSTKIGSAVSINEGISLNSAIAPTATNLTSAIFGTGKDSTLGKYIQNITQVYADFTATAGYGASISTTSINVRRQSDKANSQLISGTWGNTANPVALSGIYEIVAYVRDSRGRTDMLTITVNVEPYSPPTINNFTTARTVDITSNVLATIDVAWDSLGGVNLADITITRTDSALNEVTIFELLNSSSGVFSTPQTFTGQSDAASFTYTITIIDDMDNIAVASATVGTSFVEFSISRGNGIGVGKVWERGSLDVAGPAYILGKLRIGDYDLIVEDNNDGARGLELGNGLYLRNGYLEVEAYDEAVYGVGRMQSYYDAFNKKFRMYGRDETYGSVPIELDLAYGGQIIQEDWVLASLMNGWENYSSTNGGFIRTRYRKTTHGTVQVIGLVRYGISATVFQLPVGYRPNCTFMFAGVTGTGTISRVDVTVDGYIQVKASSPQNLSFVSLNLEFPLGVG